MAFSFQSTMRLLLQGYRSEIDTVNEDEWCLPGGLAQARPTVVQGSCDFRMLLVMDGLESAAASAYGRSLGRCSSPQGLACLGQMSSRKAA